MNNKKILIVYTGGTIGMIQTEKGYSPTSGVLLNSLNKIPDLFSKDMPKWDLIEMDTLLDSSNITVTQWNEIGSIIRDNYDNYDGFVILHGTDTMAYTSSALSFMLENLAKPVIITGSQIPLVELRSDGRDNIITSIYIAAQGEVNEVCLYFGGKLLRGNRSMKYSADGLIAFTSPNLPPLAEVGIEINYNRSILLPKPKEDFYMVEMKDVPIGVIKVFPGIQFQLFEQIMTERLKGIVIETFGAGNIPSYGDALLPIIKKAFTNGTIVTVCSQCPQGSVALGTYETSNTLMLSGAVSAYDMTTEAAVAKLYYLFSCDKTKDEIKLLMEENLCGELRNNGCNN